MYIPINNTYSAEVLLRKFYTGYYGEISKEGETVESVDDVNEPALLKDPISIHLFDVKFHNCSFIRSFW